MPNLAKNHGLFYTDDRDVYQEVLPEERYIISDYKKDMNHVERFNNSLRQRASRLVRKAISFSKLKKITMTLSNNLYKDSIESMKVHWYNYRILEGK